MNANNHNRCERDKEGQDAIALGSTFHFLRESLSSIASELECHWAVLKRRRMFVNECKSPVQVVMRSDTQFPGDRRVGGVRDNGQGLKWMSVRRQWNWFPQRTHVKWMLLMTG